MSVELTVLEAGHSGELCKLMEWPNCRMTVCEFLIGVVGQVHAMFTAVQKFVRDDHLYAKGVPEKLIQYVE